MTTTVNEVDLGIPVLPQTEGERMAAREVRKQWRLYEQKERQLQLTEIELEGLQFMLGEKLSGMKSLLGMCGRGEQCTFPSSLRTDVPVGTESAQALHRLNGRA